MLLAVLSNSSLVQSRCVNDCPSLTQPSAWKVSPAAGASLVPGSSLPGGMKSLQSGDDNGAAAAAPRLSGLFFFPRPRPVYKRKFKSCAAFETQICKHAVQV